MGGIGGMREADILPRAAAADGKGGPRRRRGGPPAPRRSGPRPASPRAFPLTPRPDAAR
ncbi:hypothetical protein EXY28_29665 [Burkholderia pseudomallei]|nr:hypothetical protein EXY28_29665 [Burkholderia pseudomallei]